MAELKTIPTRASVYKFLEGILDESKRADCYQLLDLMRKVTKAEPKMWGTSIVGFGKCHYVYGSGREGDWFLTGFSPGKQNLTIYVAGGFDPHEELLKQLGRHSTSKGCLHIHTLAEINPKVLKKLIRLATERAAAMNGGKQQLNR